MLGILLLSGTFVSVYAPSPLVRVVASVPVLKDQSGLELFHAGVGKVAMIESVLVSQTEDHTFAFIVQVKNSEGVTVQLSWVNGVLPLGEKLMVSQSWIPTEEGVYTIEVFVWTAIDNPDPLSPIREREIDVLSATQSLPFDFDISTDPESLKIQKGKSTELLVTVEPIGEEVHKVRLFLDNVPNGISVVLEQDLIWNRPPYSLPVKISVANSVVLGTYSFDIVGESGAIHRSVTVNVTVVKEDL
jgi:hypothetical protein